MGSVGHIRSHSVIWDRGSLLEPQDVELLQFCRAGASRMTPEVLRTHETRVPGPSRPLLSTTDPTHCLTGPGVQFWSSLSSALEVSLCAQSLSQELECNSGLMDLFSTLGTLAGLTPSAHLGPTPI